MQTSTSRCISLWRCYSHCRELAPLLLTLTTCKFTLDTWTLYMQSVLAIGGLTVRFFLTSKLKQDSCYQKEITFSRLG